MFEQKLEETFKRIFDVKKISYDQPGESAEQDCLFIEVESSRNHPKDGRFIAKVTGNAVLIGPNDKMPFGFFSKKIDEADPADTKDLFFYDIEANTRRYRNLVQRGFSFVYFFDGQYDPDLGSIEDVTISITEE